MGKFVIKYKQNPHQADFHNDIESKFLHLSSGFGGGKSFALVMKAFQLLKLNKGLSGGLIDRSIADYKKDVLPLIEEICDVNKIRYRYHRTDKWFLFPWSRGKLFVASAEKKIRGPNWAFACINEATLITHERYKEVLGRVRLKRAPCPQIASCGTPEGKDNWAYDFFIDAPKPKSRIIFGDTRNNLENLADDYVATLEASYDPIMLDAYLRGLFVNMKGNRFYYAYDPGRNDDARIEPDGGEVHVSLDYNVAPMVATLWNVRIVKRWVGDHAVPILNPATGLPERMAVAFDQIVIPDGADTHKMCDAFTARGLDPATTTIYPDPAGKNRRTSGPPDNEILKSHGWWKIKTKLAAPQFRKRQLAVNNLLAKGFIKVHPTKCKALRKDLEGVEQDPATYEKIKSNPDMTHASDGMDYFIDLTFPLSGTKPDSRSTKYR